MTNLTVDHKSCPYQMRARFMLRMPHPNDTFAPLNLVSIIQNTPEVIGAGMLIRDMYTNSTRFHPGTDQLKGSTGIFFYKNSDSSGPIPSHQIGQSGSLECEAAHRGIVNTSVTISWFNSNGAPQILVAFPEFLFLQFPFTDLLYAPTTNAFGHNCTNVSDIHALVRFKADPISNRLDFDRQRNLLLIKIIPYIQVKDNFSSSFVKWKGQAGLLP
jgi:hypothetical protein